MIFAVMEVTAVLDFAFAANTNALFACIFGHRAIWLAGQDLAF